MMRRAPITATANHCRHSCPLLLVVGERLTPSRLFCVPLMLWHRGERVGFGR